MFSLAWITIKKKKMMHDIALCTSLFHTKITARVTKSLHQGCGPCYLHLPNFSFTYTLFFCGKIKIAVITVFFNKLDHRPLFNCIWDYSGVRIGFNMKNKQHTLPIVYTKFQSSFYSELNEVCDTYVWMFKWVNLHYN